MSGSSKRRDAEQVIERTLVAEGAVFGQYVQLLGGHRRVLFTIDGRKGSYVFSYSGKTLGNHLKNMRSTLRGIIRETREKPIIQDE